MKAPSGAFFVNTLKNYIDQINALKIVKYYLYI